MIQKDGSGPRPWRVRWKDADRRDFQASFRTKAEAEEFELDKKMEVQRVRAGMPETRPDIPFGELADLWTANFSPSRWRLAMLQHSTTRWGPIRVRQIKPEAVGAWLHALPFAPKTKTHILQTMRQVLNAGVEWGYLVRSPARPGAFKAPGTKRVRPIRPFESWDEVAAVAEAIPAQSSLIRFLAATGLRSPSEWKAATWQDVDLAGRLMTVHGTKTAAAARTIPLSLRAVEALEELPRGLPPLPVFPWFDYHQWRKTTWPEALDGLGLARRHPYELRHTFATLALQNGASLDDVAEMLGHEDIGITRDYYRKWTRPMTDRLRGVLDTIDKEVKDEAADI